MCEIARRRLPGRTARGKVGARATKPTAFPAVAELSVAVLLSQSLIGRKTWERK